MGKVKLPSELHKTLFHVYLTDSEFDMINRYANYHQVSMSHAMREAAKIVMTNFREVKDEQNWMQKEQEF